MFIFLVNVNLRCSRNCSCQQKLYLLILRTAKHINIKRWQLIGEKMVKKTL